MNYITISVGLVADHEAEGIDGAIGQGLEALSKEIGGPVELVSVVPVPIGEKLCVTVLAKPYEAPQKHQNGYLPGMIVSPKDAEVLRGLLG